MIKQLRIAAEIKNIAIATAFMNDILDKAGCKPRAKMQLEIVMDEMMSNVARYAYGAGKGDIVVKVDILHNPLRAFITLEDSGMPYNPLEKEDPDITLAAEERDIGGLGIFIVKKYTDEITYDYRDNHNILTIVKRID